MNARLVSVKKAAKMFNFPQQKLYQLVRNREVPFIEIENLSGSISNKINTRVFEEWLNDLAEGKKII